MATACSWSISLAARWGCLQDNAGTTVWFQIGAGDDPAHAE